MISIDIMPDPCLVSDSFSLPPPLFGVLFVKENKTHSPKQINVDKNLLALHSPFFRTLFFSESELNKISAVDHQHEISIEPPVTFEHLKLLIDLLHDKKGEKSLNDSNVEGILHLAHQFMIEHVLGMCAKFLISKNSKMIKLQKYRIADKYSLLALREIILNKVNRADFYDAKNFMANFNEVTSLSEEAKHELSVRFHQIFHGQ
ncbi:hypothetical protein niasHS_004944 [Heterodera schachtii]|uniref:BTB domain-containing protein n=1 Tax=Heterodera schachtii TaxID=97005 RepID=A0ABD2K078_HETSC